jgi:hypothetical protein
MIGKAVRLTLLGRGSFAPAPHIWIMISQASLNDTVISVSRGSR